MKATRALLAIVLVGFCLTACGSDPVTGSKRASNPSPKIGASKPDTGISSPVPTGSYLKDDGDKDSDDEAHKGKRADDLDDQPFLNAYGRKAGPSERRTITTLIKSYYTAAAAGDAAKVCSLLSGSLSAGLTEQHNPTGSVGKTCATEVSRLLSSKHMQFAEDEVATMVVSSVRAKGDLGLAVLGFRKVPERAILIEREGATWKIGSLFDTDLP